MTSEQSEALNREVERRFEQAALEPGMTFDQARERLERAGFDEHAAAMYATYHVEAHEHPKAEVAGAKAG